MGVLTIITILIKHQSAQSCKLNQFNYDEHLPSPRFYELPTSDRGIRWLFTASLKAPSVIHTSAWWGADRLYARVCDWICKYAAKYIICSPFLWRESLKQYDNLQSVNVGDLLDLKTTCLLIEQIPEMWLAKLELQLYSRWALTDPQKGRLGVMKHDK